MNAIPVDRTSRTPRVVFQQPVRVVPLGGPPRAFRVLAGNLSRGGMFLNTDQPFDEGTRVALSLEASGRVLPFAQGEVVWRRYGDGKPGPGFGVKFTGFLHPRAHDMVGYLVKAIESGEPLTYGEKPGHSWKQVAVAGALALIAGAALTAGFLFFFGGSGDAVEDQDAEAAPAVTAAPVAPAVEAPAPVPAVAAPVVAAPEVVAPAPVKTIDLAPMVLDLTPPSTPVAKPEPVEGRGLALPSGAATRMGWRRTGDAMTLTLTLAPGARVEKAFLLSKPSRVAIDVSGAVPKKSHVVQGPDATLFERVRVGRVGKSTTRLVVDLARPGKKVETHGAAITVTW